MANPRIPSDYWDDSEQEELHYPRATRRRVVFAHALGVVGVLGTFTLAAFAFAPRMPFISAKVHSLLAKEEPALRSAEPITQVAVTSSPEPSASISQPAPTPPAPDVTATEPSTASVAAIAPVVATAPAPAVAVPPAAAPAPESVAAPSAPASAPDTVSEKGAKSSQESTKPAGRALAASTVRKAPRSEPPLTMREIERRKERSEAWLKQEGLEPVR